MVQRLKGTLLQPSRVLNSKIKFSLSGCLRFIAFKHMIVMGRWLHESLWCNLPLVVGYKQCLPSMVLHLQNFCALARQVFACLDWRSWYMLDELLLIVMADFSCGRCRQRFTFRLIEQKAACLVATIHDLHPSELGYWNFLESERIHALMIYARSESAILRIGRWFNLGLS